ncbi:hypothetical protein [Microbacterium sp. SA39]|uniref:hypothetical protein n=1 Tax=Microbacterium sp. SA39 TaxID=1263625 RepID=UPI0005F9E091|nr:hypothetical protein [Microbacterium sp. SA39]KJQ54622.1 hypothetical protein RS85_01776 [Microbacterium sp. SA39]
MAVELVLLSDIPLSDEVMLETALQVIPDGAAFSYRDGQITQFADVNAAPVLTVFEPMVVHEPLEARRLIKDPPVSFGLWTEMTIPFAGSVAGRPLAEAFARAVRGSVREKL